MEFNKSNSVKLAEEDLREVIVAGIEKLYGLSIPKGSEPEICIYHALNTEVFEGNEYDAISYSAKVSWEDL